ncbi:MAG: bifunctional DNA-formamidopyrimidine glycosylase/DNA-(apurinic or apyrimidinic site) lyase [Caulobacteraceae bacterium]
MPELPEVETVMRGLESVLCGARLARIEARRADLRFPFPRGFVRRLTGARVERLERRGKFILAFLDRGETLAIHLGMTGRFQIEGPSQARRPGPFAIAAPADARHAHVVFETQAADRITFFDPRRFGSMDLIATDRLAEHPSFARMGPEPLGPDFHASHLAAAFSGRRQGAKTLLLDQSIVAGLGNIYVCEALHRARVSPSRPAGRLSRAKLAVLAGAVRDVLAEAIAAGGSTLRDYAAADGSLGHFQHQFRVYGREAEPCPAPHCSGLVRRMVQAGRATFYCPKCQK